MIIIGNKMMNWLLIIIIHYTGEKYWSPSLWKIISIIISTIYLIITEHYPDTLLSWCYGNQMGRRYHSTKTENQLVAILHLMKFYTSDPCDLWRGSVQEYVLPCTAWSRLRQWRRRIPPCRSLASICPGVVTTDHLGDTNGCVDHHWSSWWWSSCVDSDHQ